METTKQVTHILTTPYASVNRQTAQKLAGELDSIQPGETVEINARHTDLVTSSFTEELATVLFQDKKVSGVQVRGTLPGMFSGIKEAAEQQGYLDRVTYIPLSQI